ncbi:MAG: hypothetical protein HY647_07100 [Acidobacteria bacterium]|nr:hypothetical protein [Acidobacteriota bacterium]
MDDHLKQLMKQLGTAINESLSESESVAHILADIRGAGYDVFLMLEATIGFQPRPKSLSSGFSTAAGDQRGQHTEGELVLTPQDTEFLKSLKIRVGGNSE